MPDSITCARVPANCADIASSSFPISTDIKTNQCNKLFFFCSTQQLLTYSTGFIFVEDLCRDAHDCPVAICNRCEHFGIWVHAIAFRFTLMLPKRAGLYSHTLKGVVHTTKQIYPAGSFRSSAGCWLSECCTLSVSKIMGRLLNLR